MNGSCIIKHFEHYSPLSDSDKALLDSLEKGPKSYVKGTTVWDQGSSSDHFYTVKNGWAFSHRVLEDGSRQVLDIFVPGDIVGLREFAFNKRVSGLTVMSDAELCAFPKTRLTEVFAESVVLCNIFFMIAARDQAILLERLVNLGRRSAREKLAHFLVEIFERLKKTNSDVGARSKLPLTQPMLGDALGLSAVHVNRVFRELKDEGLISPGKGDVELLDIKGLEEVAHFDHTYLQEDIDDMLEQARKLQSGSNRRAQH
ncbi:Crp/Fnr family transcriptional regulator [Marinobacter nanhaiticus D15-8W]|uniref:Crp/Fnr family transcriptional regulator n=1 Tax=Marinobacter nanhaiticus D15-8W TaxID=626887 RepID=N6WPH3_9GAMM|nr:Crp/Fnr family transcriptional regulator [Marinobacter nanhaiticus]ENO12967.2 Crp/Fnr family transcriptional regulator [Marinobacter nanhaiticus D15-8W]